MAEPERMAEVFVAGCRNEVWGKIMKLVVILLAAGLMNSPLQAEGADQKTAPTPTPTENASTQAPKAVVASAGPQNSKQEAKETKGDPGKAAALPATPEYAIGTEDVLAINVWKEPEISGTVPVRPDGKVTVPLIGEIQAKGLTPTELETNITKALRTFVANPEVSVIVKEVHSQKFNILGEVGKPGSYPLAKPTTVIDALALAGGFRDFAKVTKIYVLRVRSDGSRHTLPFNYKDVIKGKRFEQNVELMPGDTIIVP
jgi:polysaccharide biosynthesis/export protein